MTHEEIQAELSAFALGALDSNERQEVEQHLAAGCDACQRELATWREVVGTLALEDQDAEAPNLKRALLQRVQPPRRRGKVVSLPRWALVPLAAAATVLLVLGAAHDAGRRSILDQQRQQLASLRNTLSRTHDDVQRLTADLAAKEGDVTALRAALVAAQETLAIVQAPGLQLVHLKETAQAQPAEAHVLINADTHRAVLYAFDLSPVPPDRTYELWWITEKEGPVNAGLFRLDPHGMGRIDTHVPTDAGSIRAAAVTIEPAAGVPKPTGPMVLLGALS